MAKLCARGKAAAKRKFKVYPSAYANMYASGVCSGKITPGGKKKKKAKKGLRNWVAQRWVDIANRRSDGSYPPCGRSKGEKRKNYPKCVPLAKARSMSSGQRRAAVSRKKKAERKARKGKRPNYAKT